MPLLEFRLESLISVSVRVTSVLFAFGISAILARTLGAAELGAYFYALTLIMLVSVPLYQSLSTLSVREIAAGKLRAQSNSFYRFLKWFDFLTVVYSTAVIICLIVAWMIFERLDKSDNNQITIMLVGVGLIISMGMYATRASAIRGLGYGNLGQMPDALLRPGIFAGIIGIMVAMDWSDNFSPSQIMILHTISSFFALFFASSLLKWIILNRPAQAQNSDTTDLNFNKWDLTRSLFPLYTLAVLQIANISVDVIFLGIYHSNTEVGIYRILTQLAGLVSFGLLAINPILHGPIAKFHANGDVNTLQKKVSFAVRFMFLIAALPLMVLIFFGEFLLAFIYGNEFLAGYQPLIILLFAQVVNVAIGPVAALLNMTGNDHLTLRGMFLALGINLLLCSLLIPGHGLLGASIANLMATICWKISLWIYVKKRLKLESSVFG